jgi:agmatine deiminase
MLTAKSTMETTPAEMGFTMPAEWEPHEATWLGWPHNESDWPGKLDAIRWVYGEMVRKISPGEVVRLLVRNKAEERFARSYLSRANCDLQRVQFVVHPTNRGWTRDTGPIFVRRGRSGVARQTSKSETAIVHFHFNAWAKYIGRRTAAFPRRPRVCCAKNFFTRTATASRSSSKAAASRSTAAVRC